MRSALFRDAMQHKMLLSYKRFGEKNLSVPSSRVKQYLQYDIDRFSRNVGKKLPSYAAWNPDRTQISIVTYRFLILGTYQPESIDVSKVVGIRGYFSKPEGGPRAKSFGRCCYISPALTLNIHHFAHVVYPWLSYNPHSIRKIFLVCGMKAYRWSGSAATPVLNLGTRSTGVVNITPCRSFPGK
jgi:hypothetical protein